MAAGHGRRRTSSAQRGQKAPCPPEAVARPRRRVLPIRAPTFDRRAGSSVSDASIVSSTAMADDTARPVRNPTPSTSIPSSATITVMPANRTARPDVSIAATTASWTLPPLR